MNKKDYLQSIHYPLYMSWIYLYYFYNFAIWLTRIKSNILKYVYIYTKMGVANKHKTNLNQRAKIKIHNSQSRSDISCRILNIFTSNIRTFKWKEREKNINSYHFLAKKEINFRSFNPFTQFQFDLQVIYKFHAVF